jgi:hypothetical protein
LFSGGVIKNKKLQRGNIFEFQDVLDQSKGGSKKKGQSKPQVKENPNEPSTE